MQALETSRSRRRLRGGTVGITLGILAITLTQFACSGGRSQPATVDLAPFQTLTQNAACARSRNSLFLIDDRYVFWARADALCLDNNDALTLYDRTPDVVLCRTSASVDGPERRCQDEASRALFATMAQNLAAPDLGLGSSHRVRAVPLNGTAAPRATLSASPSPAPPLLTQQDCEQAGGAWGRWGMNPTMYCQVAALDADFPCTTGDDCHLGHCLSRTGRKPGGCQRYPAEFGCYAEIVQGAVTNEICVD